jgi:hypothetical protein
LGAAATLTQKYSGKAEVQTSQRISNTTSYLPVNQLGQAFSPLLFGLNIHACFVRFLTQTAALKTHINAKLGSLVRVTVTLKLQLKVLCNKTTFF